MMSTRHPRGSSDRMLPFSVGPTCAMVLAYDRNILQQLQLQHTEKRRQNAIRRSSYYGTILAPPDATGYSHDTPVL